MLDALYISAIGLQAQKERLDTAANNLANVDTPAFKRQTVDFAALLDRAADTRGVDASGAVTLPHNRVLRLDFSPGDVRATGRALDVAILGAGFFEVELPGGRTGYSRGGSLQIDAEGVLAVANGYKLTADIVIPGRATDVQILADGSVSAVLHGEDAPSVLGNIELATFDNPEALEYRGEGIYTAPESGPQPLRARPGEDGAGELVPRHLEASNVRVVDEMVSLMLMQRVYELNSRIAQMADELMGMSNNLRRN